MPVIRTAAVLVLVLSSAACASFAETAECGAPRLVTMSGAASAPLTTEPAIEMWGPDGASEVLTRDRAAYEPVLSPDGETVALALGEGEWSESTGWESSRVALLSVDSGEVALLSREVPGTRVTSLQWSTGGAEIAFLRSGADVREIVAADVGTGEERRLLALSDGQVRFTWSPDGSEMLVPTAVDPATPGVVELRRYFLGSGHHVVLTTSQEGIGQVAWSPGGRWVAMQAAIPGTRRQRLFVLDLEVAVGEWVPVDLRSGGPRAMTWSGPYLLYVYGVGPELELALMSWDSRTRRRAPVERVGLERFGQGTISAARCDSSSV